MTKKKTTRKRTKKLSNDPVTISEFQSWLSGVVEFQTKDWTPNKAQWEAILNKINNLTHDVPVNVESQPQRQTNQTNASQPSAPQLDMSNHRKSFLNNAPRQGAPVHAGPAPVQLTDESTNVKYVEEKAPPGAPVPEGKIIKSTAPAVKTEHMAPSESNGKSSFE